MYYIFTHIYELYLLAILMYTRIYLATSAFSLNLLDSFLEERNMRFGS